MRADMEELIGNLSQDMMMADQANDGIWWADNRQNQLRTEAWESLARSGLFRVSRQGGVVTLRIGKRPHLKVVK